MLNVTEKALDALTTVLDTYETGPEEALRITPSAGGFSLIVDEQHEGDQVVSQGERAVLLVEQRVSDTLGGVVLDAVESPGGPQLTLRPPEDA
ncbi:MAG TPA: hypothetical protein VMR52_03455 [Dehalococcoidia bacterium]|nr:hypothetical protein [Dehalococcoidia bacterium]